MLRLGSGLSIFCSVALHAQTLTWDANGNGADGATAGSGTWNTTNTNWYNGSSTDVVWPNSTSGDTAVFGAGTGGGAYTISVGTVNAGGIIFNQGGYTLSGGTITLNPSGSTITTNGGTTSISSVLDIPAGNTITKAGPGTLVLSGFVNGSNSGAVNALVTGGTFSSSLGYYSSVLSVSYGTIFGTQPSSPTTEFTLDGGTMFFTNSGSVNGSGRTFQITSNGGAIVDTGGGYSFDDNMNLASGATLYLANTGTNATTYFADTAPQITGSGNVVWNGAGTGNFTGPSTYTGSTTVTRGTMQMGSTSGSFVPSSGETAQFTTSLGSGTSLANGTVTIASGAVLSLQGADLPFTLGSAPVALTAQPGTITVGGMNNLRVVTGPSLAAGSYPLFSARTFNLGSGSFQFDGGSTLSVPATSSIEEFGGTTVQGGTNGGTFYRLTLQTAGNIEQVVVAPAQGTLINVMPVGSSITEGVSSQGTGYSGGGYRSQLYQMLVNDGRLIPNFVGSSTLLDNTATTGGYNVLTGANQLHHEGHGGYTTYNVLNNLNANDGTGGNNGGYWLRSGNGVNPDYVTVFIGGNDYGADSTQTTGPELRMDAIVTTMEALRPAANIVVANLLYRTQTTGNYVVGNLQNTYYNPLVPGTVYNHVLAGQHVSFCDSYTAVTPGNNIANVGPDGIHPLTTGYNLLASAWYNVIAFGSAYWTGSQDNQWSTLTAANATNFAQNYQLTTPYTAPLGPSADVYFNNNTAPLPTVLGANLAVRGVNFAAGATGPVTVGGNNTLTINAGGITVQQGTGPHTIAANVVLGAAQTWGNVSANNFTVSGTVSGMQGLTVTGSYTLQLQIATGTTITPLTYLGTGPITLSGANTYSGGTTVSSGTLVLSNTSGSGTGTGPVNVLSGATLTDNGAIGGALTLTGTVNGHGAFGNAVTIGSGGVFQATGSIAGALTVNGGGLMMVTGGGAVSVAGGVVNNGTIRLEKGAALTVGAGQTLINNGTLDIITGSFSAPGGFTNNGVVLDSSLVAVTSTSLTGTTFTLTINSYTGHTYQLQSSGSLTGTFTNLGAPQSGTTGTVLTFTDPGASSTQNFYRIAVDP